MAKFFDDLPTRGRLRMRFRPDSYWYWPNEISPNIKCNLRRKALKVAMKLGELEQIEPQEFRDTASASSRRPPSFISGEYLDDCLPGEVEIARVTVRGRNDDSPGMSGSAIEVSSIRARPDNDGIRYRIVMENMDPKPRCKADPEWTKEPLTLQELIDFMFIADVVEYWWASDEGPAKVPYAFTRISSEYYPQLSRAWDIRFRKWRRGQL